MDVKFYQRLLNEKLTQVRTAFDHFVRVFGENDPNAKLEAARTLSSAVEALSDSLSGQDRPSWLGQLQDSLRRYQQRAQLEGEANKLLRALFEIDSAVRTQSWVAIEADGQLDFESIYAKYLSESRLDDLFDEMVGGLEQIIVSGQVDSIRVLNALEKVRDTLKRNVRTSYWARANAWRFASLFFKNFLWEALSDIPALGAATRALRTTHDSVEKAIVDVEGSARLEVERVVAASVQRSLPPEPTPRLLPAARKVDREDAPLMSSESESDASTTRIPGEGTTD